MGLFNNRKKQIKNRVSSKEKSKRYSLIPEGFEREYESWVKEKEFEELYSRKIEEIFGKKMEGYKPRSKRTTFVESLKTDDKGSTILFQKKKVEDKDKDKDIYRIVMDFIKRRNLTLNDGVKVNVQGRDSAIIKYRNEKGEVITETVSIVTQEQDNIHDL